MAATYAAQVSEALHTLLDTTRVNVHPVVEFVSCGAGLNEHFVPKTSLEKHLRKCHGERRPRPIHNAAFYYGRRNEENAAVSEDTGTSGALLEDGTGGSPDDDESGLQSLVEPETEGQEAGAVQEKGVIAAIQRVTASASAFYEQVQAWRRIPLEYATMKDNERKLVTSSAVRRWLNAELSRPGILPSGDPIDEELVEYVAGLLDHPDFCQPDLLVLELHEFLGRNVTNIVLALWKFMIVEIGLRSVFKTEKSGTGNKIQVISTVTKRESAAQNAVPRKSQPPSGDALTEHDYKRRRVSYRGKVGTKTGPAAFREMIQKHMVGLSLEMDRELVLGGGFHDEVNSGSKPNTTQLARREAVDWRNFTDALEVRNRSRQDKRSSKRRRSKSRSRSRRRDSTSDSYAAGKTAHRRHKGDASTERSGRRSPERRRRSSRSPRSSRRRDCRDSDCRHSSARRQSFSVDRDRDEYHRREYYRR